MRRIEIFHAYWSPLIALVVRTVCSTGDMNEVAVVGHGFGSTNWVTSSATAQMTSADICAIRRSISVCSNPTTDWGGHCKHARRVALATSEHPALVDINGAIPKRKYRRRYRYDA